jgi:hypothetical protein
MRWSVTASRIQLAEHTSLYGDGVLEPPGILHQGEHGVFTVAKMTLSHALETVLFECAAK